MADGRRRGGGGGRVGALVLCGLLVLGGEGRAQSGASMEEVPSLRAEVRLRPDRRLDVDFIVSPGGELPPLLRARAERAEAAVVPGAGDDEAPTWGWTDLTETEAVALLLEGRQAEANLGVRILMSPGVAFDDIWELQNVLTQAGIRRVRFVSGVP